MGILMAGIDHSIAPIDIRTVFSFTKRSTEEAYAWLKQVKGIEGCVLISTCNRMELYLSTGEEFEGDVFDLLCGLRGLSRQLAQEYRSYFRIRQEREAVHHLFRLAGGLESRILGDDQIITQVKDAFTFAREHYAADHVLETLFRQAITAAKKVKTSDELSPSDQSVVRTAIRTLKEEGFTFEGKTCMVIGNGVMGKLAATQLQQQGADVTVTVRQYRSGVVEIPRHCSRIDYGRRMDLFDRCDYVLSATVSPNYTLTKELVAQCRSSAAEKAALTASKHGEAVFSDDGKVCQPKPVVLIDLAVPRDIDPGIAELEGVRLYDIDCFREEAVSEAQKKAIADAEACFAEQMEEFFDWYECVDVIPRIQSIKEQAAIDLENRLTKKLRALPMEETEKATLREDIESAAERMMNKLLFGLRGNISEAAFRECIAGLEKVYKENGKPYVREDNDRQP
ncbi:MAG: glutamyl-tRNA reductase [Lachnospiraceae bacterium]|nr:glutamyl-tRNA reductase [Lachnospiraceae bacterium]